MWFIRFCSPFFIALWVTVDLNQLFSRQEDRDREHGSYHPDIAGKLAHLSTDDTTLTDWHLGFHISLVVAHCSLITLDEWSSDCLPMLTFFFLANDMTEVNFLTNGKCNNPFDWTIFALLLAGYASRIYTNACGWIYSFCW